MSARMLVYTYACLHTCLSTRVGGHGSRTLQQGLAGGGRGKLASANEHCECAPD